MRFKRLHVGQYLLQQKLVLVQELWGGGVMGATGAVGVTGPAGGTGAVGGTGDAVFVK